MKPRPQTLTLAFTLILAADCPILTLSFALFTSSISPNSPPPPPPPPLPLWSSRPPIPRRSPPPLPRPAPPQPPPFPSDPFPPFHQDVPFWSPVPSANDQGGVRKPLSPPPPVPCAITSGLACDRRPSPPTWGGQPSGVSGRSSSWRGSELNLGKKVGLAFVAVLVVLQVVLGGFLIYKRLQIGKFGYQRDLASASHSAVPSAN